MAVAMHNHSNTSDPNEFATLDSLAAALKMSSYFKVNLDIGHFTAANYDAVAYIREHHASITNLHIKDRKKNQGDNTAWGTGDTPIRDVLQLLKREGWPIRAYMEYEHRGTAGAVEEVKTCVAFASARSPDQTSCVFSGPNQALAPDVPPVFRLGGLVGDDGHVARPDARLLRRADRPGGRHHGAGGDDLAVLRRHDRRPIPRDREDPRCAASRRRAILFYGSTMSTFGPFYVVLLAYALCYMPTLALSNSLSFHHMREPAREFPAIRVLGTIGWIVAGLLVGTLGLEASAMPMRLAGGASLVLALFCLALPHTPPARSRRVSMADVLGLEAWVSCANVRSPSSCSARS